MNWKKILYRVAQVLAIPPVLVLMLLAVLAEEFTQFYDWVETQFEIFELWCYDVPLGYFYNDPRVKKEK
jgi:hypothetical protein